MPSSSPYLSAAGKLAEMRRRSLEELSRRRLEERTRKRSVMESHSDQWGGEIVIDLDDGDHHFRQGKRSRLLATPRVSSRLADRKLAQEAEEVQDLGKGKRSLILQATKLVKEVVVQEIRTEAKACGSQRRGRVVTKEKRVVVKAKKVVVDLKNAEKSVEGKGKLSCGKLKEKRLEDVVLGCGQGLTDDQKVKETLRTFYALYLQAIPEEDKRYALELESWRSGPKPSKRPDLKATKKMKDNEAVLNAEKRIGVIPGVHVGQHFLSRTEMVVIGLDHQWINGIDYIAPTNMRKDAKVGLSVFLENQMPKDVKVSLPIAVAIVMSGGYEDDIDNYEDVIYTGQGGNDLTGDKRQKRDQEMVKGNLALRNSMVYHTPVRVIRGHKSKSSYTGKVYTYDGLYEVTGHWAEKGISGFRVFKYKLHRLPGQPTLTSSQVHFVRGKRPTAELRGLVSKDISNGLERIPVPASNVIDTPRCIPTGYEYKNKVQWADDVKKPPPAKGCNCRGSCANSKSCACARLNGNSIPYVSNHGGRLMKAMDVVYECGPGCGCDSSCINRTSQNGLKYRLEVFKTATKGWAVRSLDSIPPGAPICEYIGLLRRNDETLESMLDNSFIFELDCVQTMCGIDGRQKRWGHVSTLWDNHTDISRDEVVREGNHPAYVLDAGKVGGVSRFINHSCEPNVFIQCVLSEHHDITMPRIVMFAADNILPSDELTYDYGYALNSVVAADGTVKEMPCHCGALTCRKRMY